MTGKYTSNRNGLGRANGYISGEARSSTREDTKDYAFMNDKPETLEAVPPAEFRGHNPELFEQLVCSQSIFDTIGDGLVVVNCQGGVIFHNRIACTMLGDELPSFTMSDWQSRFGYRLPDTETPPELDDLPLIQAMKGHDVTRQEMQLSGPGVRSIWLSVTGRAVYNDQGGFEWAYIVLRDVNLRKWSEETMRLHQRAMASASEGIVILAAHHSDKPVLHLNEGFERLTGYHRDEVLGKGAEILFGLAPDDETYRGYIDRLESQHTLSVERENFRKDGSRFWNRVSVTPIRDTLGTITHYVAILSDITDRILTEQRLKQATEDLKTANQKITWANERMKRNLQAAAKVQHALLPSSLPEITGAKFSWAFEPNEELSGDILNIFQLDDEHVAMYILDVTGHGVASAMLSVTVSRLLWPIRSATALVYDRIPSTNEYRIASPRKVANRLAMRFEWDLDTGQFFTLIYGILNCRTRVFEYVCAGHPQPAYVGQDGDSIISQTNDLPIGIGEPPYHKRQLVMAPGSRLYLYSDGIIESVNSHNELFGQERLLDTLANARGLSLDDSINSLMSQIKNWREGGPVKDDISIIGVELDG